MNKLFQILVLVLFLVGMALCFTSCTQNERARSLGGTAVEVLPKGRKLVNVTWKETELWILTRPMTVDDVAESYEFKESSSWGLLEGTVKIQEVK